MTSGSTTPAILARGVGKSFGEHRVLDQVDLTVAEGTIFSLLGPNGAGQDHDGAHPLDPDPGRRRGHPGRRARSCEPRRTGCAPRSASPASSPRWTTCSPAPRTCA